VDLLELMYYRVAADHHAGNPTKVRLYISKSEAYGEREVEIQRGTVGALVGVARRLAGVIRRLASRGAS